MSLSRTPFPVSFFEQLSEVEQGHWWFRARNRVLLWVIAKKIKPFFSLMEVGCGTGYVLEGIREVYPSAELFGAEYYDEGLYFARKRVPNASFRQLDATVMDDSDCYDVIGAFDVIEHIEEDEKVLVNLARAIKPGGSLIITVPQHRWLWSQVDEHACHVRRYTRTELVKKVNKTSLSVEYVTSFVSFLVPLMWLSRLRRFKGGCDPMSEFRIPCWLNSSFEMIMHIELALLKLGLRLPFGGSLILVAKKRR